jgi:hypothetical protein
LLSCNEIRRGWERPFLNKKNKIKSQIIVIKTTRKIPRSVGVMGWTQKFFSSSPTFKMTLTSLFVRGRTACSGASYKNRKIKIFYLKNKVIKIFKIKLFNSLLESFRFG